MEDSFFIIVKEDIMNNIESMIEEIVEEWKDVLEELA